MLVKREAIKTMRAFFGDSIKGTADFSVDLDRHWRRPRPADRLIPPPVPDRATDPGLAGLLLLALYLGKSGAPASRWTTPCRRTRAEKSGRNIFWLRPTPLPARNALLPPWGSTTGITFLLYGGSMALPALVLITAFLAFGFPVCQFDMALGKGIFRATGNPVIPAFASHCADRSAGCRLCDDFSVDDHRHDPVRADRRGPVG
ncbi:MAG: hypothetical protein IPI44_22175 [Sulfuritalea sp.]|nr:hypothetical protein [Sulfuritalea sp.]